MDQTIPSNIPNINLVCRLCLCEDVYLFPIFNETNIYLPQRIAACVNVEVYNTDTISTLICKQCLKKINDWHEFKRYCTEAQSKLHYWSNLCDTTTNETTVDKRNSIIIKEEIIICDDEDVIITDSVDLNVETIEDNYEDVSCNDDNTQNEETDPVSTTMYFSRDDETCLNEPEPETLLIPTHELSPEAHGLINPVRHYQQQKQKPRDSNDTVDLKISQVYQVIPCRVCNLTFSSTSLRSKHEKREHMIYFKENKCYACNSVWNDESELIDHYQLNHSLKSGFFKTENKLIKNGCTYNTIEQSREYLKDFAENLMKLRNNITGAKYVTLNSFEYYNQCVQKIIDRNSMDSDACLENVLEHLLEQNVIIKNSCHQCCISFKNVGEFKQHISKRYCKKRMRLVESGEIRANQHFKCVQCDRIFGCTNVLTQHIRLEHVVEKVPERCRTCQKYFHSKQDYNAHVEEKCSYLIYCSICDELFNSSAEFKRHCDVHKEIIVKTEEPQTIYRRKKKSDWNTRCCLCPKVYQYYNSLERHFTMCHPKFNLNTCPYCGDIFLSEIELERHKQYLHYDGSGENRTNDQMYFCTDCNSVFRTIDELERHKTVHSDSNSNVNEFSDSSSSLTCTICEQTFNFEEQLKQHIIRQHKDGKIERLRFRCTICKKDFKTNKSLVQHDKQKHSIAVKNMGVSCPRCGRKFKNEQQIKYHMKNKGGCLGPSKKQSKSKVFNIKAEIDDESYNSNMNNSSYHGCVVCKKFFISKRNLVSHTKVHFPFKKMDGLPCQLCHKICETVEELLDHFKTHPSKELNDYFGTLNATPTSIVNVKQEMDPDEFGCLPCGKYFGTKFGLTMHNVMKHPEKASPAATTTPKPTITKPTIPRPILPKPIIPKPTTSAVARPPSPLASIRSTKCVICNKILPTTNDLVNHVQEHIARQHKFVCKKCNNLYDVDVYHMHMSKVHGIHFCPLCNKSSFISYVSVLGHVSWHKRGMKLSIKCEKSDF